MLKLWSDGNKILELNAPTASGKTLDLYIFGRILEKEYNTKKVIFSSPQVTLIEQGNLFNLPKLVGKRNYKCLGLPECTAEECPFTAKEEGFGSCDRCSYRRAKAAFKMQDFGAVTLSRYLVDPSIYSKTKCLLIDESSELENILLDKATISLELDLNKIIKKKSLKDKIADVQHYLDSFDVKPYLKERSSKLHTEVSKLSTQCIDYRKEIFREGRHPNSSEIKRLKTIQRTYNEYHRNEISCEEALRYIDLEVPYCLVANTEEVWNPTLRRKIVDIVPYFKLLDSHIVFGELISNLECVVLASGTPTTSLVTSKHKSVVVKHPIDVERRLIHYDPVGSMNYACREQTAEKMAIRIKQLHDTYSQKTIVHCGSYAVAQLINEHLCRLHPNIVLQEPGWREQALLDWQKRDDSIFLSVRYEEGISLDGPHYPMNIIAKIPFPNMTDAWITKRNKLDNWNWYNIVTAVLVQQACGRTTRGPDDYSETHILDGSFGSFYNRNKHLFMTWFSDALRQG